MSSSNISTQDFAEDKDAKKKLVLETIAKESLPHLGNSKLDATILSGGITNYAYKVFVADDEDTCVFAKLSFEYALWSPDTHHDLQRTVNEYEMQKLMCNHVPECVVKPLACLDVQHNDQKAKLLVTEWSKASEQFGNQFADGAVDERIAPKLADTLAKLHNIKHDFDDDFNEQVKPAMVGLLQFVKSTAGEVCSKETPKDRTEGYCKEVGKEELLKILQANIDNLDQRDCLIHSDAHVFNILVESKPSIADLEQFGPEGLMVLCDWETVIVGPIGKDIGGAIAAPVGCLVGHMLNGYREKSIDKYITTLLDDYTSKMMEAGKTQEEMAVIFRNILGWCGMVQYVVFHFLGVQLDAFGVEGDDLQAFVRDSMGILGLKLMKVAYEDTDQIYTMDTLKTIFKNLVDQEVALAETNFASRKRKMLTRKSSLLRMQNRRISDASTFLLTVNGLEGIEESLLNL